MYTTATLLNRDNAMTSMSGAPTGTAATIVAHGANLDADSSRQNLSLHADVKLLTSICVALALPKRCFLLEAL